MDGEDSVHRVWGDMVKLKFVLSLLLTPLVNPLVMFTVELVEGGGADSVMESEEYLNGEGFAEEED